MARTLKLKPEGPEAQRLLLAALHRWGTVPTTGNLHSWVRMHTCGGQVHFTVPLELFSLYGPLPFTSEGKKLGWTRLLLSRNRERTILASDFSCPGYTPPAP